MSDDDWRNWKNGRYDNRYDGIKRHSGQRGFRHRRNKRKIIISIVICLIAITGFILFNGGQLPNISIPIFPTSPSSNSANNSTSKPIIPLPKLPTIPVPKIPSVALPKLPTISLPKIPSVTLPKLPTLTNTQQTVQPSLNELRNYTLQLINQDRVENGLPPVTLDNNQAAQTHAQDMLNVRTLSHYMTDGEKPYMVYTKFNGVGYVAQNAAFKGYADVGQCSNFGVICDPIDPKQAIEQSEYDMMHNDQASNWGHRDNILDKYHTAVSIGVAYDKYSFYIVQNFENNYIDYSVPISENKGIVSFSGNLKSGTIQNVGLFYDPLPTNEFYQEHKNDGFYELGQQLTTVQPPLPSGEYYPPGNDTFEVADMWMQQGNQVNLAFDISPFVIQPGVYTVVVFLGDNQDQFPVTSYSITKTTPMVSNGFKSPKVYYACTTTQLEQYDQLQQQYDTLQSQYNGRPQTATSDQEYQQDMQMYNQLNSLQKQMENFRC